MKKLSVIHNDVFNRLIVVIILVAANHHTACFHHMEFHITTGPSFSSLKVCPRRMRDRITGVGSRSGGVANDK